VAAPAYDFAGRVAIVTGAGSGIGREVATGLAACGAKVAILDISSAGAERTVAEIKKAGGTAMAAFADVGEEDSVEGALRQVRAKLGPASVLVNNAGIVDDKALPADVPTATWDQVIRVNLTGCFLMAREVIPEMLAAGGGSIVNVSSAAGTKGGTGGVSYTVSKHGVVGLTRSLAYAYGDRGLRVNAVLPGPTETGMGGGSPVEFSEEGSARLAPVRAVFGALHGETRGEPRQVAAAVLFLASDAADLVNGALLPVDAGWAAA
jgi:NAD(P)-dependent dehydrogenase (short-subunit alcohol dehydrogenase family)